MRKARKGGNKRILISKPKGVLLLFLIIVLCISATKLFYESYSITEIRKLPVRVLVRNVVGLGLEEGVVFFGAVPPGGTSNRQIIIVNYKNESLKVSMKFNGKTSHWIHADEKNFILDGGEKRDISFSICIPENTKQGEYTGEIIVVFKKVA